MEKRNFVDTPGTPGEGSTAERLRKYKADNRKLRRRIRFAAALILGLAACLLYAVQAKAADKDLTTVRPARPGYSKVVIRDVYQSERPKVSETGDTGRGSSSNPPVKEKPKGKVRNG